VGVFLGRVFVSYRADKSYIFTANWKQHYHLFGGVADEFTFINQDVGTGGFEDFVVGRSGNTEDFFYLQVKICLLLFILSYFY
jgi:hypothetical protein